MENNYKIFDLLIKTLLAFIAGGWTIWNYLSTRKREGVKILNELHSKYNSKEFIEIRAKLWLKLDEANKSYNYKSFAQIWTKQDEKGEILEFDLVSMFYQYGAFWNGFLALFTNNQIPKKYAIELFSYQYTYWYHHIVQFAHYTMTNDEDHPDIFKAFVNDDLHWLINKNVNTIYQLDKN